MRSLLYLSIQVLCLWAFSFPSMASEDSLWLQTRTIPRLDILPQPTTIPPYWSQLSNQTIQFSPQEWQIAADWVNHYIQFANNALDSLPSSPNAGSIGGLLDHEIATLQRARAVISSIKIAGNLLTKLTGQDLVQLPIGLTKEIGNTSYTMGIASIQLYPTYAQLEVFLEIDAPNLPMPLMFSSPDIKFSASGGIIGGASLMLLGNIPIEIVPGRSAVVLMRGSNGSNGLVSGGTFVSIDCDGFQSLGLDAIVEFSRAWIKPANDNGSRKVSGRIATIISDWDDILLEIDLEDFVITKMEDVIWRVDRAIFDFSDWRNANGLVFPLNGYDPPLSDHRWRGFYIKEFRVEVPEKLSGNANGMLIQGNDIIIDDMGFTGSALATPILSLDDGDLGGWAFSIDTFGISVIANQIESVAFNGLINLPLAKSKSVSAGGGEAEIDATDCLRYQAFIGNGDEYFFSVSPVSTFAVDIWQAEVGFDACSYIDIFDQGDGFTVVANLHGYATISSGENGNLGLKADSIHFQELQLSNHNPYFKPGFWSFPSLSPNFGAFALTLEDIGLYPADEQGEKVELGFNALISLSPSDDLGITACGGFAMQGELVQQNGRQRWRYAGMRVDDIFINVSAPGFGVTGGLSFYKDDPSFGNGFRGMVAAWFRGVNDPEGGAPPGVENSTTCFGSPPSNTWGISAMGQFGTVDGFDYFIVDALVHLGEGIPILSEALKLKSFGGGVYRRMGRAESTFAALEQAEENLERVIPPLGSSLTGIQYFPDRTVGMGIKATVLLAAKEEKAMNANATFEVIFNHTGGLAKISFYGTAKFMQDISFDEPFFEDLGTSMPPPVLASMSAFFSLDLNFEAWELDANMAVFVNAGAGAIKGAGANGKMGWANLYVSRDHGWHLKAGEPSDRNGIIIGIPKIAEELVKLQCYLMMGSHDIPGIPPIESDLMARIMQYDKNQSSISNRPALVSQGGGFAFGASLDINTGERNFLIFYGHFGLSLGFDVAVQDFGEAQCAGGGQIGINGWYASGQAWAGIGAGIGIKVRLFGKPKKFSIAEISAGAILQAKLPNPFWAKGTIGAQYDILNGLIKGNWTFDLTIGEECNIIGADDPGIVKVIESIEPKTSLDAVDVSTTPKVNFLVPVEKAYSFTNLAGEQETYRVRINKQETYIIANGQQIKGDIQIAEDHYSALFIPNRILAGETQTQFFISIYFEERQGNSWIPVKENNLLVIEKDTLTFHTGPGLDYIPLNNVIASYPLDGQYNFYRKTYELGKGYLLLARAQPDLLQNLPEGYTQGIRLTKSQEPFSQVFDFQVDQEGKNISFSFPEGFLEKAQIYQLELIQFPVQDNGPAAAETAILYTLYFRTSQYATLQEKLANLSPLNMGNRGGLIAKAFIDEPFGVFELGRGQEQGLIKMEADLRPSWYQQAGIHNMYNGFPVTVEGCVNTQELGILPHPSYGENPALAVRLGQQLMVPKIDKTLFDDPSLLSATGPTEISFNYLTPMVIQQHFDGLYAEAAAIIAQATAYFDTNNTSVFAGGIVNDFNIGNGSNTNSGPPNIEELAQLCPSMLPLINFCNNRLNPFSNGVYPIQLKYKLPGMAVFRAEMNLQLIKNNNE
ncbi:MAG: hypothetical protein R2828_01030 [Saprospiraceae bacterium]